MKKLIMTVGLPRSGKSTWARKQGHPIAKYMVQSLFLAGHDTVILDATNTTAQRREEWDSTDWNVEYKLFETDMNIVLIGYI